VHRLFRKARRDLDAIRDYVFAASGSEKLADAQIYSITIRKSLVDMRLHLLWPGPRANGGSRKRRNPACLYR
jgi:hypothetical protein